MELNSVGGYTDNINTMHTPVSTFDLLQRVSKLLAQGPLPARETAESGNTVSAMSHP